MRVLSSSLFGRMLGLSLLATLAALIVAGVAIGGVLQRFVTDGVDERLGDRLTALESAVRPDGTLDRVQLGRVAARIAPGEPWRIDTPVARASGGGTMLPPEHRHRGPPAPPLPPAPRLGAARPFEARLVEGARVHGLAAITATRAGEVRVLVAVRRQELDDPVLAALAPLAASLAVLGLALGGAAMLQLRVGLHPLRAFQAAVEEIRRGRATRVPEEVPDELAPLARELNALAADNAAALGAARASAANLAHALKTPVATLALHLADDATAQAQLARIDATVRHHLGRARAAAADRRARTLLGPALDDLAQTVARLHHRRVAIRLEVPAEVAAAVGGQDLAEIAGNLLDNAARHAATQVVVTAAADGRLVRLTIRDDGPGIPAEYRTRAIAPGTRLDERGDGHGFGLAIARELTELHGGRMILDDAPGGGLIADVILPRAG